MIVYEEEEQLEESWPFLILIVYLIRILTGRSRPKK